MIKENRQVKINIKTAVAVAAGLLVAGCGTAAVTATSTPGGVPKHQMTPPPAAAPSHNAQQSTTTGPLGTTFKVSGGENGPNTVYTIKAATVQDPAAPGDEFSAAPAGKHLVGVKLVMTGQSGSTTDDANMEAVVVGSNGQVYQPAFDTLAAGTDFDAGQFTVSPGQTEKGWLAFEVPDGVAVHSVQWEPDGGFSNSPPVTWNTGS